MNVEYKKLIMGLLLLVQFPTAIANSGNKLYDPNGTRYSQCSVSLLDDNRVEVSFQAQVPFILSGGPLASSLIETVGGKLLNISPSDTKHIKPNPHRALLSLYFYHADGTRDLTIQLNNISDISLNGIIPSGSNDNTQEIQFNSGSLFTNTSDYNVSFKISANTLKNISIAATVGGELRYQRQSYSLLSSQGVSFSSDGKQCRDFDPQTEVAPESLKIDPKFHMDSAIWQLKTLDLDELLDKTANNHGLSTQLINAGNNRFCLKYRSIATLNTRYMISATNLNGLASNNQYFQLKEKEGNNFINYKVKLRNNENAGVDFEIPTDKKYFQLKSDNNQVMLDMCWAPQVLLFSTDKTDKGSYSDTLNFTITPLA